MLFTLPELERAAIYAQAFQGSPRREQPYRGATGRETAVRPVHCAATGIYPEGAGSRLRSNRPRFRQTMPDHQVRHPSLRRRTGVSRFRD